MTTYFILLLKVAEKISTQKVFMYTKRMWVTYRCFNQLQQMSHVHSPIFHDERYKILINHQTS